MKKDILTVSRVLRLLNKAEIEIDNLQFEDIMSAAVLMSIIEEKEISELILDVISDSGDERDNNLIIRFMIYVSDELLAFNEEISKRKNHVIGLEFYIEDTEEELLAKLEKTKNSYPADIYLHNYSMLSKNGINPESLSVYESMILAEEIICSEINKATLEILSIVDSENHSFCESIREIVDFANFYSFALDIYNDASEMYQDIERKRRSKQ
jgi:hypothetical protein